jgi:hypothetical protein
VEGGLGWRVLKGLRGLSTPLAHCSAGFCPQPSSAPPLSSSPSKGFPSFFTLTLPTLKVVGVKHLVWSIRSV